MKRTACFVMIAALAAGAVAFGQAADVDKILAAARAALGGEKKLAGVKTFAATGQSTRVMGDQSSAPTDAELAFELPDRFMKKDVLAAIGSMIITRTSGFNGDTAINVIDQPPQTGGNVVMFKFGTGGGAPGELVTSEQKDAEKRAALVSSRQDFARLSLGILLASPAAYPLKFAYAGQAESPDGKADIVEVRGEGDFLVKLFIDTQTHLPLMASWLAKEPLVISRTMTAGGPGAPPPPGGGGNVVIGGRQATAAGGQPMTPEDREKMMKQFQDQAKEAEAKLRVVEYRLYYGDYRDVDGVKVPFKLQRSIDGKPTEEVTLEKVKINAKIDPKKFETK